MKRFPFLLVLVMNMMIDPAFAGDMYRIELTDGSVLTGELVSLSGGVCTLRTDALGTVKIEEKRIASMRSMNAPAAGPAPTGGDVSKLKDRMEADPDIMSMIRSLQDDPAFKKALEDPALLRAVEAGDLNTLMANPAFLQLLNSSKVREIQGKVSK